MINLKPNFEINRDNSIISLDNVNAGYGSLQVLFNISFGIPDRSFVAIVGRNGAGKTTLLKTISGFIKPYSGKIIYKGDDITNLPPYKRAQMGLVYLRQDKRIFDNLTTKECLEITAYAFNKSKNDIEKVLEHFPRLKERIDSKSKFLSGGERQMLLLAQGLLSGAEILMIDEPSEGLAAGIIRELSKVFIELKKEAQKTIIVVEQNVQLVRMLADIVMVLAEGKLIDIIEDRSSIENLDLGNYKI
jgi:branched-chain amino acid transport system ATP-binding protein